MIINKIKLIFGAISYFLTDCAKNLCTFLAQSYIFCNFAPKFKQNGSSHHRA
jgi:hypothetical protein